MGTNLKRQDGYNSQPMALPSRPHAPLFPHGFQERHRTNHSPLLQNSAHHQEHQNTQQLLSKHGLHRMHTLHPSETFKILTQLPRPTPQNSQASPPPASELHLHQHSRTSLAQAKGTGAIVLPEQSVPSIRTRDSFKSLLCSICKKVFKLVSGVKTHLQNEHTKKDG